MRYINSYHSHNSVKEAVNNNELGRPFVVYLEDEQRLVYDELPGGPANIPLTFEVTSDGYIYFKMYGENFHGENYIEYRVANPEAGMDFWEEFPTTGMNPYLEVYSGQSYEFRVSWLDHSSYGSSSWFQSFSGSTAGFKVKGNIMSLFDSENYAEMTELTTGYSYSLYNLFAGCTGLTDAHELVLPEPNTDHCFESMFEGDTALVSAPCLGSMFVNNYAYKRMFYGCSSLENIHCNWSSMMSSGQNIFDDWVAGVAPMGMFFCDTYSSWATGDSGVPSGWMQMTFTDCGL